MQITHKYRYETSSFLYSILLSLLFLLLILFPLLSPSSRVSGACSALQLGCTTSCQYSEWTPCTDPCLGLGYRTRDSKCMWSDGTQASMALCLLGCPLTYDLCVGTCKQWRTQEWGECTGGVCSPTGLQSREIYCYDTDNQVVSSGCPASTAPVTTQLCTMPTCYSYHTTEWGSCQTGGLNNCGGSNSGVQTRSISCWDDTYGVQQSDFTRCAGQVQPDSTRACTPTNHCYSWQASGYGSCSVTCGPGTRTRSVTCRDDTANSDVSNSICTATPGIGARPTSTQICSNHDCYAWSSTAWSTCSTTCGDGTQTRSLTCANLSAGNTTVDPALCDTYAAPRPSTSQVCRVKDCYDWSIGSWTTCPATCGYGTQTRTVDCINLSAGNTVASSAACKSFFGASTPMPNTTQPCKLSSCYAWHTSIWSDCSVPCAGVGMRTRTRQCWDLTENVVASDSACTGLGLAPPVTQEACDNGPCDCTLIEPSNGGWGDCVSPLPSGAECNITCAAGYTHESNLTRCAESELFMQSCAALCTMPTPPLGTIVGSCTAGVLDGHNESCSLSLMTGYSVTSGSLTLVCHDGQLTLPTIEPSPCQLTLPMGGSWNNCSATLAHSSSCSMACLTGYELIGSSDGYSCAFGQLTGTQSCQPYTGVWDYTGWGACSTTCDEGIQVRTPVCVTGTGTCDPASK